MLEDAGALVETSAHEPVPPLRGCEPRLSVDVRVLDGPRERCVQVLLLVVEQGKPRFLRLASREDVRPRLLGDIEEVPRMAIPVIVQLSLG